MAYVRTVQRGTHLYRYLVQSYRWNGKLLRKELYLGTSVPRDLAPFKLKLERQIWEDTWFAEFDRIRAGYQERLRSVPGSVLEQERREFVLEFTYNTNRIEGSTMTLEDTRLLLERGIVTPMRPVRDIMETQLHAKLLERLIANPEPVDLDHLLAWHKELFSQSKPDLAGRLRDYNVRIGGSKHLPPPANEAGAMLQELLRWVKNSAKRLHAVEIAGEFHFRFEYIHPFGDGNGRVGRLAMNMLLSNRGFPMLNIPYVRRRGYYSALEASSVKDDPRPFLNWFFLRFSRSNRFFLGPQRNSRR